MKTKKAKRYSYLFSSGVTYFSNKTELRICLKINSYNSHVSETKWWHEVILDFKRFPTYHTPSKIIQCSAKKPILLSVWILLIVLKQKRRVNIEHFS